jgi:hypothetical protein
VSTWLVMRGYPAPVSVSTHATRAEAAAEVDRLNVGVDALDAADWHHMALQAPTGAQ